ncbi:hypothetical protein J6590_087678 [Homalodisca vitripennis]|nr:hypothetical protein J6590_087678 [Homalodisca vitripennis]
MTLSYLWRAACTEEDNRDLERCQPTTQCIAELSTYSYTISPGIALSYLWRAIITEDNRDRERCQPTTQSIAELSTYSFTISPGIALS